MTQTNTYVAISEERAKAQLETIKADVLNGGYSGEMLALKLDTLVAAAQLVEMSKMYWENHGDKEEPDYTDMVQDNPNTSQSKSA